MSDEHERSELLATLATHRGFLRQTVRGLSDEQAGRRTTASELCLGGLLKHVAYVEQGWAAFIEQGPSAIPAVDDAAMAAHTDSFQVLPDETVDDLLANFEAVARRTEAVVTALPSLDVAHPLPEAPWYPPGAEWSARRVLLHILAETAQHAGHADIIREALDGAKTMG
jgi:uncharacterized damage-inducible protein DinB